MWPTQMALWIMPKVGCRILKTSKRKIAMKNFKIWSFVVLVLIAMTACDNGGGKKDNSKIVGEWRIESWDNMEPSFDVYIAFNEDGTFDIYQQVYSLDYVMYDGDYTVSGNKLSGVYHDGTPWKCNYIGSVSEDGNTMTLVSDQLNPVTCVYEACVIPDDVIEEASTRSTELFDYFL